MGRPYNCEDNDDGQKPFTYCGKSHCESCGGDEEWENNLQNSYLAKILEQNNKIKTL